MVENGVLRRAVENTAHVASFDLTQLQTHRAAQGAILDHLRVWWRSRAFPTCRQCNVHVFNHGSTITSTGTKLLISARSQPVIAYEVAALILVRRSVWILWPCCSSYPWEFLSSCRHIRGRHVSYASGTQASCWRDFLRAEGPVWLYDVPSPTPCTLYTG